MPPEIWNDRLLAPDGTCSVYTTSLPLAADRPVTGTPFVRVLSPGLPGSPGSPPPPPPAAATAALASTMPAPHPPEQLPGSARAVSLRICSTCAGLRVPPAAACISATTPATCGAAMEVPDMRL